MLDLATLRSGDLIVVNDGEPQPVISMDEFMDVIFGFGLREVRRQMRPESRISRMAREGRMPIRYEMPLAAAMAARF